MKQEKDRWIEETLSSLDGLVAAEPDPQLYFRIRARIARLNDRQTAAYSPTIVWAGLAAFIVLFAANAGMLSRSETSVSAASSKQDIVSAVVTEYRIAPSVSIYSGE